MRSPLGMPLTHESGLRHATGEALYVDDLPMPRGGLYGWVVTSPHAHARILRKDATRARALPGVHAVLFSHDVPGKNLIGPVVHDEPLLAGDEVLFVGHTVALVVAESYALCREAASLLVFDYEPLPSCLTIPEAIQQRSYLCEPHCIRRGDVDTALSKSALRLQGEVSSGAQDHFYLETQASLATPMEGGALHIHCSTQHPTEVQGVVAGVLKLLKHQVVVEVPRMGGGFGGKETQAAPFAALAGLAAIKTGRPVKVWLNRDQDMIQTGKRHPFWGRFDAGFSHEGILTGMRVELYSNGGYSVDLSPAIMDRALFHLDNAYYLEHVDFRGTPLRTHLPSNTAFRGFGGPQGMLVVEEVLNRAAERLRQDPAELRRRNFYADAPRNRTPYGQEVKDCRLARIHAELMVSSEYQQRRGEIDAFNLASRQLKRGIGFMPVKFGISFTTGYLNQAGALVNVYTDGTVQLNHGGTEMGQGLHTKMLAVCAHELGVPLTSIRVMATTTDKVPNTSATAASSGSDLNGEAVRQACALLKARLHSVALKLLGIPDVGPDGLIFEGGRIRPRDAEHPGVTFAEVALAAHQSQVSLSATGYYRTPDIRYDKALGQGKPFHYFAYGAAVAEVEVSGLTGEHRLRRVDILQDVGDSLVPSVDRGQVEGAFIQGVGWLTCEEALVDDKGCLLTHCPDTYKIPALGDAPEQFRVALLSHAAQADVIHGSKAVGEPPLMLALSVVTALRHAVGAFGPEGRPVRLSIPCTPEAIFWSVQDARASS